MSVNVVNTENDILGSLLLGSKDIHQVLDTLSGDEFFYKPNKIIYKAIKYLFQKEGFIDINLLADYLQSKGKLEEIGGLPYLSSLIKDALDINVVYHVQQLRKKYILDLAYKRLEQAGKKENLDELYDLLLKIEQVIVESDVLEYTTPIEKILKEREEFADKIAKTKNVAELGIQSGFREIDDIILYFPPKTFNVIGARPSMGKTSLALNMMLRMAEQGNKVGFFSLEMSKEEVGDRFLSILSEVPIRDIRTGVITTEQSRKLKQVSYSNIYIDDTAYMDIDTLRYRIGHLKSKYDIDVVFIDYLQLLTLKGSSKKKYEEVSIISRRLKEIAKVFDLPIIALAQLNRAVEQRKDKRPILSDLRDSGSIEADADIIMFLYRDDVYNRNDYIDRDLVPMDVNIAKNRQGRVGDCKLGFWRTTLKVDTLAMLEYQVLSKGGIL